MLAMGWWGMRRAKSKSDFLVAGRRLGPTMYSGTMAAIVLGGASTIGGVGLGYQYGLSGAWMVFTIGLGLLALCVVLLRPHRPAEGLHGRRDAGPALRRLRPALISGVVMWAYTLMLAVTSTIAYATIFDVLFGMDRMARDHPRRRHRRRVLDARRHVVDHADGHGAVRREDGRRAAAAAAHRRRQGGRLRRDARRSCPTTTSPRWASAARRSSPTC